MSDTILYAVVIYSVGCIVPTPLDQTPPPTNYPPTFVTSKVTPPFGPISFTQMDQFELNIVVQDPDVDDPDSQDDLYARLFYLDSGKLVWNGSEIKLNAPQVPDPTSPHLRYGTFPANFWCVVAPTKNGVNYLYAIVSDRKFSNTNPSTSDGGLTDTNHWELTCM